MRHLAHGQLSRPVQHASDFRLRPAKQLFIRATLAVHLPDQFPRLVAFRNRPPAVAPLHCGLEALLLRIAPKPQALGVVAGDAVKHRGHHLALLQPHRQHDLVHHHFVHGQVRARHTGNPVGQLERGGLKLICWHRFIDGENLDWQAIQVGVWIGQERLVAMSKNSL